MPSRQRFVVVGVLALAALLGLVLSHGLQWALQSYGVVDPTPFGLRDLPLSSLAAYTAALGAGILILRVSSTRQLAGEIVEELARVSWPSRQETGNATMVVIVAVLVCSAYLGLFDAVWLWLTNMVLGVRAPTPG
ncbi:MAG: preprotein translocase subunit SecE [Deltaproteobacteria bacterium]|nr:MAG: preprotein translocase subunit SecE [Deltaproteobacteria bacterium]